MTVPGNSHAIPPIKLIKTIGGTGPEDYISVGNHFLDLFVRIGGLKPSDRVLDVGCGCGRMATALTGYLTTGSYEGFDIIPELVEWCRKNISPRFPRFRFQHANLFNSRYNREASREATTFSFPYPDAQFDFTVLTSVFTHLLPADMNHYAREIHRTLKPGGRALITFFIMNEEAKRLKETPASKVQFLHSHSGGKVWIDNAEIPEAVVAYPEESVRQALSENGLSLIEPIHFGSWCGRESEVTFQDLTVSVRS